jgi:hypothetical protein
MPIQVQCPGCGRQFQAADELAGKRAKCPQCSAAISVPAAQEAAWYVQTGDGRQHGPMTQARVERLVAEGRLNCFCRLRHETWSDWKWAEDLFPQLSQTEESASAGEDARQDAPAPQEIAPPPPAGARQDTAVEPPAAAPSGESAASRPRVTTCPDGGNTVSMRASRCPHCGCPAGAFADRDLGVQAAASGGQSAGPGDGATSTADALAEFGLDQEPTVPGRKRRIVVIVGSAVVLLVLAVAGIELASRLWRRPVSQAPSEPPAPVEAPAVPPAPPVASPEEIQAAMQQAASEAAKRLDGEFHTAYTAKSLIDQTKASAELMQALAQGNLDAIPDSLPADAAPQNATPYQSLYDSLYAECLAYLQKNVSREQFSQQAVMDAARRWEEAKRAVFEKELTEELEKQLRPQPPPSAAPK